MSSPSHIPQGYDISLQNAFPDSLIANVSKKLAMGCSTNRPASPSSRSLPLLLLLMSGQVSPNPGPSETLYPCGICSQNVKDDDNAICCDQCDVWFHQGCFISDTIFDILKDSSLSWICCKCGLPNFTSSTFFNLGHGNVQSINPFEPLSDWSDTSAGITWDSYLVESLSPNTLPPKLTSTLFENLETSIHLKV